MLKVWLPLNKDLKNNGITKSTVVASGAVLDSANYSYDFDGTDDYISVSDISQYFQGSTANFSICFWFYHTGNSRRGVIFGNYNISGSQSTGFNIEITAANLLRIYWKGNPDWTIPATSFTITSKTWYHVAVVYNGSKLQLYINGVLKAERSGALSAYSHNSVYYLGRDSRTGITAFYGKIWDFRVYNHALSIKEIKDMSVGLVAHYPFTNSNMDGMYKNSILRDCSGFGNDLVLSNNLACMMQYKSPRHSQYVHFNGSYYATGNINNNAKTVSLWFYLGSSYPSGSQIVFTHLPSKTAFGFYNNGSVIVNSGTASTPSVFSLSSLAKNSWHHAVIYNDGSPRLFLNGVQQTNTSSNYWTTTVNPLWLGRRSTGNPFTGDISDFRMYSTILTPEQILNLYKDSVMIDNEQNIHAYELTEGYSTDSSMRLTLVPYNDEDRVKRDGELRTSLYSELSLPINTSDWVGKYDKNLYTESDGSVWIHIFHNSNPATYRFVSTDSFTTSVYSNSGNTWFDFSICNKLNKWEFLVRQKIESSSTETSWRWMQNVNPMTATWDQAKLANITKVDGYSTWAADYAGMFRYTSGTTAHASTYLRQANANSSNWYGACGCWTLYNGGIPGFNGTVVKSGYIDVYVRIDNGSYLTNSSSADVVRMGNGYSTANQIYEI